MLLLAGLLILSVVSVIAFLIAGYFVGAGHGLVSRYHRKPNDYGVPMQFGLVYVFAALCALGLAALAEQDKAQTLALLGNNESTMFSILITSLAIAIVVVRAGAKMATRVFYDDVVFAHWWSAEVISIGRKRRSVWSWQV